MSDRREDWMSTGKAAALFGLHPSTIRGWCEAGYLPYVRTPSGRYLVTEEAVRAVITVGAQR